MRKVREEAGLFVAEGLKLVADAIDGGWPIRILVHRSGEDRPMLARADRGDAARPAARCWRSSADVLEKLSRRDNPQTVLGVFEQRLEPLAEPRRPAPDALWVGLDRVRDPGNLGTIIRTADAVGAEGVDADRRDHRSLRHRGGARHHGLDLQRPHRRRRRRRTSSPGARRYAGLGRRHASFRHASTIARQAYGGACLLLMGNEQQGLPDDLAAACDAAGQDPDARARPTA